MANSTKVERNLDHLHPAIRDKVKKISAQLKAENIPLQVFEAFRTPERQAQLAAKVPKVTWVGPWGSMHQYGLAVDFVIKGSGKNDWSWDTSGGKDKYWTRMHELAKEHGMTALYSKKSGKLIELPHIQLVGASTSKMRKGIYPTGGDTAWADRLNDLIDNWEGSEKAPPRLDLTDMRPPLDPELLAEMEGESEDALSNVDAAAAAASGDKRFQNLHSFVKLWEGGFVDHPRDKGGATNMGITIGTLAAWRGHDVSVDDVRNLSRAEADAIFRANYYSVSRCGEMPDRMAMVVYNCAVLSGPKRAVEFVQKGFNNLGMTADGKPLEEDGRMGPMTMGAIQKADPSMLASSFMDVQDAYLRQLGDFDVFGPGWMNRMAALREFVDTLPQGAGVRPTTTMKISDNKLDLADILKVVTAVQGGGAQSPIATIAGTLLGGGGTNVADTLLGSNAGDSANATRNKALLRLLLGDKTGGVAVDPVKVVNAADGKPPLTPVNKALGETVGRAMNGKKSVTGILGLLASVLLTPAAGATGESAILSQAAIDFLNTNGSTLITVFSLLTGWGFLGKIDKAVRLVGATNNQM
jgi:peptidoglycan L-alanyl-D-glutamate endopeptidase CwlK